jgi:hypothetical protein
MVFGTYPTLVVVTSPIYNETILVKQEPGSSEKRRVPKLLLETPVWELHNLLVAPVEQGGLPEGRGMICAISATYLPYQSF